ncbi:MAG: hypothetical protein ACLRFG_00765 [Clostridia bacterium]
MLSACDEAPKTITVGGETTFEMAVSQANSGDTILLSEDVVLDEQVDITKKLTIDLGEHVISNTTDIWDNVNDKWSLLSVQGGNLTIKNGGLYAKENDCYAIDVREGGKLTIIDGQYLGNVSAIYVYEGSLDIRGGQFAIQQLDQKTHDERFTINCYDDNYEADTANVVISGGQFANFNPDNNLSEGANTDYLVDGYTTTTDVQSGKTIYTVVAE